MGLKKKISERKPRFCTGPGTHITRFQTTRYFLGTYVPCYRIVICIRYPIYIPVWLLIVVVFCPFEVFQIWIRNSNCKRIGTRFNELDILIRRPTQISKQTHTHTHICGLLLIVELEKSWPLLLLLLVTVRRMKVLEWILQQLGHSIRPSVPRSRTLSVLSGVSAPEGSFNVPPPFCTIRP